MDFDVGEVVVCVKSGADVPNPWHRANPLTVGAEYMILGRTTFRHVSGASMGEGYAVDNSGRYWSGDMFRRKEIKSQTDISFAHDILKRVREKEDA